MEKLIYLKDVKLLLQALEDTNGQNYGRLIREFREQIDTLPVITIRRCDDCEYFSKYNHFSGRCMREYFDGATLKCTDYCSRGI